MHGTDARGSSRKWVIVHGHFYQPPRENPWLNVIEPQQSAAPSHDWNEKIYGECYRPNGYSRILDSKGMITGIHNNYSAMSFNFGPTLMSWLELNHPATTRRIVEGDRESALRRGGHGNAIAQVYNHLIMPLASRRDQLTQIRWAKAAFVKDFDRDPEGMWLAETAINMETVHCLIEERISFVILAPHQADAFRPLDGSSPWVSASESPIDTRRPYRCFAKNAAGKKTGGFLDIFFFDEQLSREISFGGLLRDANLLGSRIDSCYSGDNAEDQVVVIATDGETFGHHKPFGDMCLAFFFSHVAPRLGIQPVNFGGYRASNPPEFEVTLKNAFGEGTAWSCAHGVGRWTRNCGCQTGGKPEWNQNWRSPLREAIDNLQERIDIYYEKVCGEFQLEPWMLRDRSFDLLDTSSSKQWRRFLMQQKPGHALTSDDVRLFQRLLEAQRYILFSYTSCGWFFSDISGIETMQNLAYACRALQLGIPEAQRPEALDYFMRDLAKAQSNLNEDNGASLFGRYILPSFSHEEMLSYAVAMEKELGITDETKLERYGYLFEISMAKRSSIPDIIASDPTKTRWYRVALEHPSTGEQGIWLVAADLTDPSRPSGGVMKWRERDETRSPSVPGGKIPEFREYTLKDLFPALQQEIAGVYMQKIASRSRTEFGSWQQVNEHDLLILQSFFTALPDHFRAPLQFLIQQQWDDLFSNCAAITSGKDCYTALEAVFGKADFFSIKLDLAFSAENCEKLLTEQFEKLSENLNPVYCERIDHLMTIVDRFSLPVSKHRLEDMFFPILSGPVVRLYREITAEKKGKTTKNDDNRSLLMQKLLLFARRMNFNTDSFEMS